MLKKNIKKNAINYILSQNSEKLEKLLKSKAGRAFDVNCCDDDADMSLLNIAVSTNQFKCFRILLENGAKINFADNKGRTAMFYALEHREDIKYETQSISDYERNKTEIFKYLLSQEVRAHNGFDSSKIKLNIANHNGDTPLSYYSVSDDFEANIFNLLLDAGASPFLPTSDSDSLFSEVLEKLGYSKQYRLQIDSIIDKSSVKDIFKAVEPAKMLNILNEAIYGYEILDKLIDKMSDAELSVFEGTDIVEKLIKEKHFTMAGRFVENGFDISDILDLLIATQSDYLIDMVASKMNLPPEQIAKIDAHNELKNKIKEEKAEREARNRVLSSYELRGQSSVVVDDLDNDSSSLKIRYLYDFGLEERTTMIDDNGSISSHVRSFNDIAQKQSERLEEAHKALLKKGGISPDWKPDRNKKPAKVSSLRLKRR